jgi:thiosulfate dehydrogenase (quinone) large subunit
MQITARTHQLGVALLRVVVGVIFLWAGLDKLFGSGDKPWSAAYFLSKLTNGTLGWPFVTAPAQGTVFNPTHDLWVNLASNASLMSIVDGLVVFGECAIGVALIFGILTRFAAAMGTLMMLLFFFAAWDFAYGIVNQHLTYALVCATLVALGAGKYYGLDAIVGPMVGPKLRSWFFSGEAVPAAS